MALTHKYPDWSTQRITFSRADHPPSVPQPGHAALVVEAQIGEYNMSKVSVDGGSGLNILFANTLRAMNNHNVVGFRDVFPRHNTDRTSLFPRPDILVGCLRLEFKEERLEFKVVDWESQYHAILGRLAFSKFMAVPHYAYLKMKMAGNNGTPLTVHGSFLRSDNCDKEFNRIAQKFTGNSHLALADKFSTLMSTHAPIPVDSVGTPRAEVRRTTASFP
jgi:hypothetical protein